MWKPVAGWLLVILGVLALGALAVVFLLFRGLSADNNTDAGQSGLVSVLRQDARDTPDHKLIYWLGGHHPLNGNPSTSGDPFEWELVIQTDTWPSDVPPPEQREVTAFVVTEFRPLDTTPCCHNEFIVGSWRRPDGERVLVYVDPKATDPRLRSSVIHAPSRPTSLWTVPSRGRPRLRGRAVTAAAARRRAVACAWRGGRSRPPCGRRSPAP
jgi:hypothetical protein